MTSSDSQQPDDGTYDPTVIRPVEPASTGPDLTKRDADAATVYNATTPDPYAAPSNPYAIPADPYSQSANPYAQPVDPYAAHNPYAAPPQYPVQPFGQQQFGQQQFGQQLPGYPAYPGQPGYPAYGQGAPTGTNGLAIGALVCGIASIPLTCLYVGILLGIAGAVMGAIAMKQTKETGQDGHGMALAGAITGGVGIGLSLIYFVLIGIGLSMQ